MAAKKTADAEPKRGRGRPPLGDDALTEVIKVRVTAAEKLEAIEFAAEHGTNVSELTRETLLRSIRRRG